jgi:hypothetical protein
MFIISDRVRETSSTTGTGSVVLNGAYGAFQTFNTGIGNGNTTYYTIESTTQWEVGQGVYDSSTNSLSRDILGQIPLATFSTHTKTTLLIKRFLCM